MFNKPNKIVLRIDEIGFCLECNNAEELKLLEAIIRNKVIEKTMLESFIVSTRTAIMRLFR